MDSSRSNYLHLSLDFLQIRFLHVDVHIKQLFFFIFCNIFYIHILYYIFVVSIYMIYYVCESHGKMETSSNGVSTVKEPLISASNVRLHPNQLGGRFANRRHSHPRH